MHELDLPETLSSQWRGPGAGRQQYSAWINAQRQGIVVFNTPGANANGVKELVIAGMLLASP